MAICGDDECEDRLPPPEVTRESYLHWRDARRGRSHAEVLSNPVWSWLVRTQVSAWWANQHFEGPSSFGGNAGWCCDRFGQSETVLPDGRTVLIAGEHEDYYDPDFYIYNDVIVRHPSGAIEIFAYPESDFPPTDFHSATMLNDGSLLLIGNLGYTDNRRPGTTQVFRLDLASMEIASVATFGSAPSWLSRHKAELDGERIRVRGGEVFDGSLVENIDDWELNVSNWSWTRLTERRWTRIEVQRKDGQWNNLFDYESMQFYESREELLQGPAADVLRELHKKLGPAPDPKLLAERYRPTVPHQVLPVREDECRVRRIRVDGVIVRYVEDHTSITVTIEGQLPEETVKRLADDLVSKLERLENTEYVYCIF